MNIESYSLITELGGFGMISAILWYGITKFMPTQMSQFEESLKRQNADFFHSLEEQREFFKQELVNQRSHDEKMIEFLVDGLGRDLQRLTEARTSICRFILDQEESAVEKMQEARKKLETPEVVEEEGDA